MKNKIIEIEQDQQLLPTHLLVAGKMAAMYEAGKLRHIQFKGHEVIRMIYPALRDEHWNTIPPSIDNEIFEIGDDGFLITYTIAYEAPVIHYRAYIEIKGTPDNVIVYTMKGESWSDFKSKRIGLCVHHPILSCAGCKVEIEHPDKIEESVFPELISPLAPFTDIRKMRWVSSDNVEVEMIFEGDLFETEDQRNWTDDSYKTYSGPQHMVTMLDVRARQKMEHRITLKIKEGSESAIHKKSPAKEPRMLFPSIGYKRNEQQQILSEKDIQLFKAIPFDHYRIELYIRNNNWKEILKNAAHEASSLKVKLDLAVYFVLLSDEEIVALVSGLHDAAPLIESVLILAEGYAVAPREFFSKASAAIKNQFPDIKTGTGTNAWFADLNNNMPLQQEYDFAAFSLHPQIHQTDTRSILENLGSQHSTIETLRKTIGNKPVHVYISFNHSLYDPRLFSSFAAWWTINAIYNLADSGHITLYELMGERGLVNDNAELSPVYQLLKNIKTFNPLYIIRWRDGSGITLENASGEGMDVHFKA